MNGVSPELLEQAIQLLGEPNLTQEQAADDLVARGTDDRTASRLVSFIPEAFGIALASHIEGNPGFPSTFLARDKRGGSASVPFSSEPIFVQALLRAQTMFHEGPQNVFSAISSRSSIFKLIDHALNNELKMDGSKIAIAVGIPAEFYAKPKVSFWRKIFGS